MALRREMMMPVLDFNGMELICEEGEDEDEDEERMGKRSGSIVS